MGVHRYPAFEKMSAPSYNFRPGGFEEEDSDDDGFYLGSLEDEKELATKPSSSVSKAMQYFLF